MEDKQVTIMVLKVDLKCHRCYKKIKKVLCKIPQIQDQVYNEKQNIVTIKVVCCSPEKIKQKIICKAGCIIESIVIKVPDDKDQKKTNKETGGDPKTDQNHKEKKENEESKTNKPPDSDSKEHGSGGHSPGPSRTCCKECYEGHPGGPCMYGQGGPFPCYPYGRPVWCDIYGGGRGCYLVHYEETTSGSCLIM